MTILDLNLIKVISHNEGFGINTDILDTNILNLTVVIGVLFYYGRPLSLIRNITC